MTPRAAQPLGSALAAALLLAAPAAAQSSLHVLRVDALGMRADKLHVHVGESFHLAIHVRVREHVAALDELVVPDVGSFQLLGDERHTTHAAGGTDVVETLTLEPNAQGRFTFAPAYLDAIDARDGRPKRFSADHPVTVVVDAPVLGYAGAGGVLRGLVLAVLGGVAVVIAAALVLGRRRRRRERPLVPAPQPVVTAPPPPRTPRDAVADALRAYRVAPATAALAGLRGALFAAAGVTPGATLRDALAASGDHGLRGALLAAERAAFGPEHARDAASVELVDATAAWLR